MPEIADFATLVLVVAGGFSLAVLSTRLTDHVPVPAPAIFLIAAAIASDLWPQLYDEVAIKTVERIAVVALIVILLNGGMEIGWRRLQRSARPVLSVGLLGTFATAGLIAVFAHFALGTSWTVAGLVGAALAPTDPAVMFAVLGRREISGRSGTILEGEAGVNDPAGIALMLGMIELATHDDASVLVIGREFTVEMVVGAAFGLAGARLLIPLLRRLHLPSESLYPVLALVAGATLYGVTSIAQGSGFLAVFILGLRMGDARMPYKGEIERFQSSLASLAEVVVFVALGLTIQLGDLSGRDWLEGLALAAVLGLVVRPLVVAATLARADLTRNEKAFIAWSGLKGAVPVLLAAFGLLANVDDGQRIYGIVFVVVLASVLGQGTLVPFVAQRLRIPMRERERLPWELSVRVGEEPAAVHEHTVAAGSSWDGVTVEDLPIPADAWVTLVVRGGSALQPDGRLALRAGDRVLLIADDPASALALRTAGS
ncbi:MAG TPA: potassium/proton antiporter [Baekduia sp.]|nr:potassium/proton antiporter [Baekduia sp.]